MNSVNLKFLCDNIDTDFNSYTYEKTKIVNILYHKTYDGGPNHEIHKIIVICVDDSVDKPYYFDYYHKEYMWNSNITFEQTSCDFLETKSFKKLKELKKYLEERCHI